MSPETHRAEPFVVTAIGTPLLTRAQTRASRYRQPSRSLRVGAETADTMIERCRAVALVSRDDAVFWGPSAAMLLGLPVPYRLEGAPVHVMVPEGTSRPRRRGVRTRQADVVPWELVTVDGFRSTSPARTFADLAAELWLPDLVAVGDAAMRNLGCSRAEIDHAVLRRIRYAGRVRARTAAPMLNPAAESPQESRLRTHIVLSGLPTPVANAVIRDADGRIVARVDLLFDEWRVVAEYDGEVHAPREQRHADATRRTLLRELGFHVVEITAPDLVRPNIALGKVRRALLTNGWNPYQR